MGDNGELLSPGQIGEIVIRGDNVTKGYENNPSANAAAFTNGWFRTGDQGVMDDERYVSLTGRLKEIINRGGEKISPREVDEILMDHPSVQQVVVFAMPHEKLGEEVAAAIVLRDGAKADEKELRDFCSQRLAAFKPERRASRRDRRPEERAERVGEAIVEHGAGRVGRPPRAQHQCRARQGSARSSWSSARHRYANIAADLRGRADHRLEQPARRDPCRPATRCSSRSAPPSTQLDPVTAGKVNAVVYNRMRNRAGFSAQEWKVAYNQVKALSRPQAARRARA